MGDFKRHVLVGAAVAGGANLTYQLLRLYVSSQSPASLWDALAQVRWGRVAVYAAIGGAIASLPDLLEPAHHPNHRSVFHSVCCGGALAYGAFGKHSERWCDDDRHTARVGALAYVSHLILDAGTPKGLPLLT